MNQKVLIPFLTVLALVIGGIIVFELYLLPPQGSGPEPDPLTEGTSTPTSAPLLPSPTISGYDTTPTSEPDTGSVTVSVSPTRPYVLSTTTAGSNSAGTPDISTTPSMIRTTTVATSPVFTGPPSFTLIVTPVEKRANPGDTILYTLAIEPIAGFNKPVSLRLDVNALFLYQESFDLGSLDPPYPRTIEYQFRVPSEVPRGITVKGVLTAEGGGHKEEQDLILQIGG